MGLGVLSLLLLLIVGCGGGGGGNGNGTSGTPITATITGAAFVAVQDGKTGGWQRLSGAGPNYNFNVKSADGRYSVAWVCEGTKPQVNIVHTTTAETTGFAASCPPPTPSTISVSGSVQGLGSGQFALVSVGSQSQGVPTNGGSFNISIAPGAYDIIAVRSGASGPNKVWLRRNASFSSDTSGLLIDFNQPDGTTVRVFDVSAGSLTVSGADISETVLSQAALQSSTRLSLIGVGTAPLPYPIFPAGILQTDENFRIFVTTDLQRGEVRGLNSLPTSLSVTLPPPFDSPSFSFTSTGALAFTVQWSPYVESPVRGYRFTLGGGQQPSRWNIVISIGWLGSDLQYTTPVLNTLSGWKQDGSWDIQRGRPVDASFQVGVSSNSLQQVLDYERTGIVPDNFRLRFATRSVTLTP